MPVLDVVIGLMFVYGVLSLFCTALNEFIAQLFNLRGTTLRTGLQTLLMGSHRPWRETRVGRALYAVSKIRKPSHASAPRLEQAITLLDESKLALEKSKLPGWVAYRNALDALVSASLDVETAVAREGSALDMARNNRTDHAAQVAERASKDTSAARAAADRAASTLREARSTLERNQTETVTTFLRAEAASMKSRASVENVIAHPLIDGLRSRGLVVGPRLPSYIPPRIFANVLIDLMTPGESGGARSVRSVRTSLEKLPEGHLRRSLLVLADETGDGIEQFRLRIERWFEDAMLRVSGAYKRRTQLIILLLASAVTLAVNADSIKVWKALAANPAIRTALVAQAESFQNRSESAVSADEAPSAGSPASEQRAPAPPAAAGTIPSDSALRRSLANVEDLSAIGVPIGWRRDTKTGSYEWGWWSVPGWLITAFALTLGAPFWFDMLNKVMNIRAAGRAPEERPTSPEALPPPRGA